MVLIKSERQIVVEHGLEKKKFGKGNINNNCNTLRQLARDKSLSYFSFIPFLGSCRQVEKKQNV